MLLVATSRYMNLEEGLGNLLHGFEHFYDCAGMSEWHSRNQGPLFSGAKMSAGKLLLILQRQLGIIRFLKTCCELIMHDIPMFLSVYGQCQEVLNKGLPARGGFSPR